MKVIIEPYDPTWADEFKKHKLSLETILKDVSYLSIEHVGSTSIPGLCAKPVIDIDIIIPRSSLVSARNALVQAGYIDLGEMDIPGRHVYRQPGFGKDQPATGERTADGLCRRNTYLMLDGSVSLRNHLDLRRVLLEDAALRDEYASLKWSLAGMDFKGGVDTYTDAKSQVLRKVLTKAGWQDGDFAEVP